MAQIVVNKGSYKPFSRDRLFLNIYESLKHRKTALSDATAITERVIGSLSPYMAKGHIERSEIVQTTGLILRRFDTAAATHYEAYHPL